MVQYWPWSISNPAASMRRRPGLQFKMLRVYSKASRLILKSFWNLLKWTSDLFLLGDVLGRTSGHTQSARLQIHKSFWELRGLGLSQWASNVWPLICPNEIQLKAVNILAKVFSPFFCQSSLKRNQSADWYLPARTNLLENWGVWAHLAMSQRGRRSCPRIWLNAIEPKRCQHLGKGIQPFLLSVLIEQKAERIKDNSMSGLFWKNVAQFDGWNLSTFGLWPNRQFTCLSLSADWYLPAWQTLWRIPVLGSVADRQARLPPHLAKRN